jgi:serine/threonine protein kinase
MTRALMAFGIHSRLGAFEITQAIGKGGMGEVFRARDTKLHRDVAIKVLPALYARDAERVLRFELEARAAAAINHPNILVATCSTTIIADCIRHWRISLQLTTNTEQRRRCGVTVY